MQAVFVILNIIEATLKMWKETGEIKLNNIFYFI